MAKAKLTFNAGIFTGGPAQRAAEKALLQTAADIVSVAKQLCPVDTGRLRQSIGADPVSKDLVRVGTSVEYGKYVEYGTSRSPAQPFLTPAFAQARQTFEARLKAALKEEFNA